MRWSVLLSALVCVMLLSGEALAKKHKKKGKHSAPAVEKKKDPPKAAERPAERERERPKKVERTAAPEPKADTMSRDVIKRESKIEFDERVVQGQRAQGAVYLFQRAETQFNSLVQTPDSFKYRTVGQVFGE